ncbi:MULTISPECIES: lysozyme inhibitor LprI family protein [unclassified Pseudomonas]|uniref:lysozyme inhibitor LprI family protein n=1 Tax=unclassified Pseudomonas TaxID=196821 RepID=UPI00217FC745|nr:MULTISPECIES: lysozyme inhibitor LprI family protein [unclassified Pseudomonas]
MTFPLRTMVGSVALSALLATSLATAEQGPSFNCSEKMTGSITALICQNPGLAALDRKLATIYRDALKNAGKRGNVLKAEQRGWIKGRDVGWSPPPLQSCSIARAMAVSVSPSSRPNRPPSPPYIKVGNR